MSSVTNEAGSEAFLDLWKRGLANAHRALGSAASKAHAKATSRGFWAELRKPHEQLYLVDFELPHLLRRPALYPKA